MTLFIWAPAVCEKLKNIDTMADVNLTKTAIVYNFLCWFKHLCPYKSTKASIGMVSQTSINLFIQWAAIDLLKLILNHKDRWYRDRWLCYHGWYKLK